MRSSLARAVQRAGSGLRAATARGSLTAVVALVWLGGIGAAVLTIPPEPTQVVHWANGHMVDQEDLLPGFAREFNNAGHRTASGRRITVQVVRANSGEIAGELKARIEHHATIDEAKPDPTIVTPAADHWVTDVNHNVGREVLNLRGFQSMATTYIGIVTTRDIAQCLGWPAREIGFGDIVALATDPNGWAAYPCAKPEWGREATLAFTYPNRSSTARSVLYSLYAIAAGKPAEALTLADVADARVARYVKQFQTSIDCYVPDTLDLNVKLLTAPPCAQFSFLAEDNLVKLYQGKIRLPGGAGAPPRSLDRDMVMIYPREGAIVHNHSAFVVDADFVDPDQAEAARLWVDYLLQPAQHQAFMQEGFRRTVGTTCISPLGSPFSPCATQPARVFIPDTIDPAVAAAILRAWE